MTGISDADTLGKLTYMGRRLIDRVQKVSVLKIRLGVTFWRRIVYGQCKWFRVVFIGIRISRLCPGSKGLSHVAFTLVDVLRGLAQSRLHCVVCLRKVCFRVECNV